VIFVEENGEGSGVYWNDMRDNQQYPREERANVVDGDNDKIIGYMTARTPPIERTISLFGEKYKGTFKTADECYAFAMGVRAVLNHRARCKII
jgi:hypothetical protein